MEPKPTALVVEDDAPMAEILQFVLEQQGFEVKRAVDCKSAAVLIGSMAAPAVATLDIGLPDGSGVDLIIQIKSTPGWERVPIVMVTATPKDEQVNWAIKSGAKAYIVKPFKPGELREVVRRVVKR
jgi:two-component system phosphate regulon response regulator PhoB